MPMNDPTPEKKKLRLPPPYPRSPLPDPDLIEAVTKILTLLKKLLKRR
jgi:hypothetical protein